MVFGSLHDAVCFVYALLVLFSWYFSVGIVGIVWVVCGQMFVNIVANETKHPFCLFHSLQSLLARTVGKQDAGYAMDPFSKAAAGFPRAR